MISKVVIEIVAGLYETLLVLHIQLTWMRWRKYIFDSSATLHTDIHILYIVY